MSVFLIGSKSSTFKGVIFHFVIFKFCFKLHTFGKILVVFSIILLQLKAISDNLLDMVRKQHLLS